MNAQLKAKLLEFKRQTEANVNNARREIGQLALQVQATQSNNSVLLEQLREVNQKMGEIASGMYRRQAESRYMQIDLESKRRRADEFRLYAVAKNVFDGFRAACGLLRVENAVRSRHNRKLKELGFQVLKQAQLMHALMAQKAVRRRLGLVRSVLLSWRTHSARKRRAVYAAVARLEQKAMLGFAQARFVSRAKARRDQLAREFYSKCTLQRVFQGLKLVLRTNCLPAKLEEEFTLKVRSADITLLEQNPAQHLVEAENVRLVPAAGGRAHREARQATARIPDVFQAVPREGFRWMEAGNVDPQDRVS